MKMKISRWWSLALAGVVTAGAALFTVGPASAAGGEPPWQLQVQVNSVPDVVKNAVEDGLAVVLEVRTEGPQSKCVFVQEGSNGTGLFVEPNDWVVLTWKIAEVGRPETCLLRRNFPDPFHATAPADAAGNGHNENFWLTMPS